MLKNEGFVDKVLETMISSILAIIVEEAFINKIDVIVDATNCKLKYLQSWIDNFEHSFDIRVKLFEIDKGEAYSRNAERYQEGIQSLVPVNVIDSMYNNLKELKQNFDFEKYKL